MTLYADLEIGLHRREADSYAVELRFNRPNDDTDHRSTGGARLDPEALRALEHDAQGYGQALSGCLFADPEVRSAFERAVTVVGEQQPPMGLRVHLMVGSSAPELHRLHWETLAHPGSGAPLCTSENILFSRYLSSYDWQPVRLRARSELKALVLVANPANLGEYGLAPVDVAGELTCARENLGKMALRVLPDPGRRATIQQLVAGLREYAPDVLYLVCHGMLHKGESWLWMEDEQGNIERISGTDLVHRMQDLPERPRLVVLLSCQSAGKDGGVALAALGPKLAEAGIPAVLAMQGNLSMETAGQLMPVLFQELCKDGQIDRALAAARAAVRQRSDAFLPVLFSRLKSGQIWYVPRFSGGGKDFDSWQSLKNAIQEKRCTPVLGIGLAEAWLGQPGEVARRWAETYRYPLAPYERDQQARVAQYISRREGSNTLQSELCRAIREEVVRRYPDLLPEELSQAEFWKASQILKAHKLIADQRWEHPVTAAYRQLADLRLPIYITTTPDDLLTQALKRRGARPQVRLCPWWGPADEEELESKCLYEDEPSENAPLVYHLYGHLNTPASLVISEDHYFDFLIGYTRHKKHIPPIILDVLMSTNLLFLGFHTDDWGYRVLFRTLIAQKGIAQFRENRHVNAQVEPEEGSLIDTQRARRYLEEIFTKDNIAIYWGRSDDFLLELAAQLR